MTKTDQAIELSNAAASLLSANANACSSKANALVDELTAKAIKLLNEDGNVIIREQMAIENLEGWLSRIGVHLANCGVSLRNEITISFVAVAGGECTVVVRSSI